MMKTIFLKYAIIGLILVTMANCVYDPPIKNQKNYLCNEIVEELVFYKDSLIVKLKLDYPPHLFGNKKAIYEFRPSLIIDNDTIDLKIMKVYGEKAGSNINIISFKYGTEIHFIDTVKINGNYNELILIGGGEASHVNKNRRATIRREVLFQLKRF